MKQKFTISLIAALALAGCMGGGGNDSDTTQDMDDPKTTQDLAGDLYFGTESFTMSASGLPFAEDLSGALSLDDETITIVVGAFVSDYDTGNSGVTATRQTILITDEDDLEGTTVFNGEQVTFVNLGSGSEATLSNGQVVGLEIFEKGQHATLYNMFSYADSSNSGFDSEGFFIIGAETNPQDFPPTGTFFYEAFGQTYGNIIDLEGSVSEVSVSADFELLISVVFESGAVEGDLGFLTDPLDRDSADPVLLTFEETTLVGNGFSTTANTVVDCAECTSNSAVSGTFYGSGAQELGGLVLIDFTDPTGDGAGRYVASGGYIAELD